MCRRLNRKYLSCCRHCNFGQLESEHHLRELSYFCWGMQMLILWSILRTLSDVGVYELPSLPPVAFLVFCIL